VEAWAEVLDDTMPLQDALDAVRAHYRASREFLMPSDIIAAVRATQRARLASAGDPPIPGGLEWAQERAWRQLWCTEVKRGVDPDEATRMVNEAMHVPAVVLADQAARVKAIEQLARSKGIPS
jgi:hypothetical protein